MVVSAPETLANNKVIYRYPKLLLKWREKLNLQSKSTTNNDHRIASVKILFTLYIACQIGARKGMKIPAEIALFR